MKKCHINEDIFFFKSLIGKKSTLVELIFPFHLTSDHLIKLKKYLQLINHGKHLASC